MSHPESPAFRYWLLVGLALHVALGLALARTRATREPTRRAATSEIELLLEDGEANGTIAQRSSGTAPSAANAPSAATPMASTPKTSALETVAPSAALATPASSAATPDTPVPTLALALREPHARARARLDGIDRRHTERQITETEAPEPPSARPSAPTSAAPSRPAPERVASLTASRRTETRARGDDGTGAPPTMPTMPPTMPTMPSPSVEPDVNAPVSPRLSLDAIGVGTYNPFVGDELAAPEGSRDGATTAAASGRRLEQSIETALAKRDQHIGLGPEGPIVKQVEQLVMQGSTTANGSATLFVRTDAEGKVVHVEIREASADGPEWERIARELVSALGNTRSRVPAGSRGVSFQVRITSREQLPSGAAPGLAINMLGIPLKRGRGDNSTKISILEPRVTTTKVPLPNDPAGREVEALVVSIVPFALMADPVDIGAPARRVVHAHLTDLKVH